MSRVCGRGGEGEGLTPRANAAAKAVRVAGEGNQGVKKASIYERAARRGEGIARRGGKTAWKSIRSLSFRYRSNPRPRLTGYTKSNTRKEKKARPNRTQMPNYSPRTRKSYDELLLESWKKFMWQCLARCWQIFSRRFTKKLMCKCLNF